MKLPKLLQNTGIYTAVTVLQKGISFFLLPLYTAFLSPADYGVLGVVTSVSSFLSIFVLLGLESAAGRFYYKENENQQYAKRLYGTIACGVVCNSIAFGSIFIFGHSLIIDPLIGEINFFPYVFLGIVNVIITPLYTLFQGYLRTRQEGLHYGINTFANFLLNVSLIVIFITVFKLGVIGVLLANVITSTLFFLYSLVAFITKQKFGIEWSILKSAYKYSLPLLPHTIANWSNGTIDKLLVNGLRSQSETGLFNLAQQYGSVMNLIAQSANSAYVPWFFQKTNEGKQGVSQIVKVGDLMVAVYILIGLILTLFSKEILDVMISNPEYDTVYKIIPYIVFAYIFQGIYFLFVNILFLKDTNVIFLITVVAMGLNIGLNLLLIPQFGILGSAMACMATYFAKSILALFISKKKNKEICFEYAWMYILTFILFVITIVLFNFVNVSLWLSLIIKFSILLSVVLYFYYRYKSQVLTIISAYVSKKNPSNNH